MTTSLTTLNEQLRHPDRNLRARAALDLGNLGDADAVTMLIQALAVESDFYVREDLTWALVRMGEAAIQPLIQLLQDESPAARHHAAHTLGKIADKRAVDALIEATRDTDLRVVVKSVFSLGQIGDTRALPALMSLLGDERREVQTTLNTVIERYELASVPALLEALHHENWQVREQAADILGMLGSADTIPQVIALLPDPAWQVRFAAITALGYLGGTHARRAIEALPQDDDERVRQLIPKVLKRMRR